LEVLNDSPEEFAKDEENSGDSWLYSLRPSVEHLFCRLVSAFGAPVMATTIHELIQSVDVHAITPGAPLSDAILQRDAVYAAAGLAADDLFDVVNAPAWFTGVVFPLLVSISSVDTSGNVSASLATALLQRRVYWLAQRWIPVHFGLRSFLTCIGMEHSPALRQVHRAALR
jgi:hypothetical protein